MVLFLYPILIKVKCTLFTKQISFFLNEKSTEKSFHVDKLNLNHHLFTYLLHYFKYLVI